MSRKRNASRRQIQKKPLFRLLSLGLLVTVTFVATIYLIFLRPGTLLPNKNVNKPIGQPVKQSSVIQQKIYPVPPTAAPPAQQKSNPPKDSLQTPQKPKIAIIIDDIGYQQNIAEKFINLDLNINFSILPHSPKGQLLSQKAKDKGRDILLHIPMEPISKKWDPGPGALLLKMSHEEKIKTLLADLQSVPLAIGINNHMGSHYTEDSDAMREFLGIVKDKNLFFIDSLTSVKSVGYTLAKEMTLKTGRRDVFIDNDKDTKKIIIQLQRLVEMAIKNGQAIGIGHPHETTLQALIESQELLSDKVSLVAINEIVH